MKGNTKYVKKKVKTGFAERIYLPAVMQGLKLTFRRIFKKTFVVQYPEEKYTPHPRFRGIHRLNKDEQERVKCVACYMCATICPAEAINIVAGEAPWPDREKYPVEFEIDLNRCIDCGFCIEACPEEAISMTNKMWGCLYSRTVINKEQLLGNCKYPKSMWQLG